MAITRPEASETTGTLREISGMTVPVTTNSEVAGTGSRCGQRKLFRVVHREQGGVRDGHDFPGRRRLFRGLHSLTLLHPAKANRKRTETMRGIAISRTCSIHKQLGSECFCRSCGAGGSDELSARRTVRQTIGGL